MVLDEKGKLDCKRSLMILLNPALHGSSYFCEYKNLQSDCRVESDHIKPLPKKMQLLIASLAFFSPFSNSLPPPSSTLHFRLLASPCTATLCAVCAWPSQLPYHRPIAYTRSALAVLQLWHWHRLPELTLQPVLEVLPPHRQEL